MEEVVNRLFSGSLSATTPYTSMLPQLIILDQQSATEEKISKNGIQKTVHVVIKNSPFHLKIGVTGGMGKLDFNHIAFEGSLIYDCDGDKEVDFVRAKPMEFKSTPNEDGKSLDVEARIKVLTSQHEDMLFKVRVQAYHPVSHERINGLSIMSAPIKVISKPEQLKKRLPSKKRTINDVLADTIQRIEQKQIEQQDMIERLLEQQASSLEKRAKCATSEDTSSSSITTPQFEVIPEKSNKKETAAQQFENAFSSLIKSYNLMTPEEKPGTIRNLIRNASVRDTERVSELFDMFWAEGLQKDLGDHSTHRHLGKSDCSNECPHKQELERIDEFYKEFLSSGVSTNMASFSSGGGVSGGGVQIPGYPGGINLPNF